MIWTSCLFRDVHPSDQAGRFAHKFRPNTLSVKRLGAKKEPDERIYSPGSWLINLGSLGHLVKVLGEILWQGLLIED